MIDTHCHLYAEEFAADIDEVIQRALTHDVTRFYLPAIDSTTNEKMLALETKFPDKCSAMMGLHPCSVKENYKEELEMVKVWLSTRKFAGIGEAGLDLYWDKSWLKEQQYALEFQVSLALEYNLP